jgi:protease-4
MQSPDTDPAPSMTQALLAELRAAREATLAQQAQMASERRQERRWRLLMRLVLLGLPAVLGLVYAVSLNGLLGGERGPRDDAVGLVRIDGEIGAERLASAKTVIPALTRAFQSAATKAVVLYIDSPGGSPAEAERIKDALLALKQRHPKPLVAVISNIGASAGYLVAMHADHVYAGKYSLVGSIGAIVSTWDLHRALERLDVSQRTYTSGPLKSMLNPFEPMTATADAKAASLVHRIGQTFANELVAQRGPHLVKGTDYTTGEVWSGEEAKALGLVDEIGTLEQVVVSRLNDLPVHDFGPRRADHGVLGGWLQGAAHSVGRAVASSLVEQAKRVELR